MAAAMKEPGRWSAGLAPRYRGVLAERPGALLEIPGRMFSWLALAGTLYVSPPQAIVVLEHPKEALFQRLAMTRRTESPSPGHRVAEAEPMTNARIRGWLAHFAVVRPQSPVRRAPPTVQMFLTLAPVGGTVGFCAIGSF
jgi:hypothetical protein